MMVMVGQLKERVEREKIEVEQKSGLPQEHTTHSKHSRRADTDLPPNKPVRRWGSWASMENNNKGLNWKAEELRRKGEGFTTRT